MSYYGGIPGLYTGHSLDNILFWVGTILHIFNMRYHDHAGWNPTLSLRVNRERKEQIPRALKLYGLDDLSTC
jgi:hypothetical protein